MDLNRTAVVVLLVIAFGIGVAWNLGGPPVAHVMELRNLVTARETVDTGRWLLPTMNDAPRLAKPPLPTWMAAAGALAGGGFRSLASVRVPTVLCALLGAAGAAVYARRLGLARGVGPLTLLILPTLFLYAHEARLATWDVPAHATAMAGLAVLVIGRDTRRAWPAAIAGALFAASILSKGPVAIAVLVAPWLVATLRWRREDLAIGWRACALLGTVALGLGLAWPIHAAAHAPTLASATMWHEAGTWVSRHVRPPWFYATAVLMTGLWLPTALVVLLIPWLAPRLAARREVRLLLGWTALSLALLALIPMKKDRYLLPALYPWSMLMATWWASHDDVFPRVSRFMSRIQMGWAFALLAAAAAALAALHARAGVSGADLVRASAWVLAGWASATAIALRRPWRIERRAVLATLAAAIAVAAAGWQVQTYVDVPHVRRATDEDVGRRAGRLELPAFSSEADDLSLVWDIGRSLRPIPASVAELEQTMHEMERRAPWRLVWVATVDPDEDGALARIAASGASIEIETRDTFVRSGEDGLVKTWLSVLRVAPPGTLP